MAEMDLFQKFGINKDARYIKAALTDKSYFIKHPNVVEDYEKLEYVGDRALNLIVSIELFNHKIGNPRTMNAKYSELVNNSSNYGYFLKLGLDKHIRIGSVSQHCIPKIYADMFEAFIAAVYFTYGIEKAREIVLEAIELVGETKYLNDGKADIDVNKSTYKRLEVFDSYNMLQCIKLLKKFMGKDFAYQYLNKQRVDGVSYITISGFDGRSAEGKGRTVDDAKKDAMKNLIIKYNTTNLQAIDK